MKRKLLSLILCLVMLSSIPLFSACKTEATTDLTPLKTEYMAIDDDLSCVSINQKGVLELSFEYKDDVETFAPYTKLDEYYNPLLNYSMAFSYEYLSDCYKNNLKLDNSTIKELKEDLENLKTSLISINNSLQSLNDIIATITATSHNIVTAANSSVSISKLKDVFNEYESLLVSAVNFNNGLSNLYFNNIMRNPNPNFSNQTLSEFDATIAALLVNTRAKYQTSNITHVYITKYVLGGNLSYYYTTKVEERYPDCEQHFEAYMDDVASLYITSSAATGAGYNMESDQNLKQTFYNKAVELYNIQSVLINDFELFYNAIENVAYIETVNNANATDLDKHFIKLIDNHSNLMNEYTNIIASLIEIMK